MILFLSLLASSLWVGSSSSISILTINIWNEGLGNQLIMKFPEADHRLAEAVLSANISTGIVGLAEVRGLASWGGRLLGSCQQSMQRLVDLLNGMEKTHAPVWHAPRQPDNLDVGLIYRNDIGDGRAAKGINECDIQWPNDMTSSSTEVWPLSWDRGSVGGWCLNVFGAKYFVAVGHLDWGGMAGEYYTTYLQGDNKDSKFNGQDPIEALFGISKRVQNKLLKLAGRFIRKRLGRKLATLEAKKSDKVKQVAKVLTWTDVLKKNRLIKGSLFMGDFNAPSHLDWTRDGSYDDDRCSKSDFVRKYVRKCLKVDWPVTKVLAEGQIPDASGNKMILGTTMSDAFRLRWPDVVANPGFTWPSFAADVGVNFGKIPYTTKIDEIDRIDYIMVDDVLLSGGEHAHWKVMDATVLGGPFYVTKRLGFTLGGDPQQTNAVVALNSPELTAVSESKSYRWPSDHKAVLATFEVQEETTHVGKTEL